MARSINWDTFSPAVKKRQLWTDLKAFLTPENYEAGKWTLTDLALAGDNRVPYAFRVLDGLDANGKRSPGIFQPNVLFRFKVLSRQACCRDKSGRKIWFKSASLIESDTDNDIVTKPGDEPIPGDIVEWKGNAKQYDEYGKDVDAKTMRRWAFSGIRSDEYVEFAVDKDGCISVPYPFAYSMLKKYGKKIAMPRFRKKTERKITNWFFEEVPQSYRKPKNKDVGSLPSVE